MFYCEKCKRVVPDNEVHPFLSSFMHVTEKMGNYYTAYGQYQSPGKVGFSPVTIRGCYGKAVELEGPPEKNSDQA